MRSGKGLWQAEGSRLRRATSFPGTQAHLLPWPPPTLPRVGEPGSQGDDSPLPSRGRCCPTCDGAAPWDSVLGAGRRSPGAVPGARPSEHSHTQTTLSSTYYVLGAWGPGQKRGQVLRFQGLHRRAAPSSALATSRTRLPSA